MAALPAKSIKRVPFNKSLWILLKSLKNSSSKSIFNVIQARIFVQDLNHQNPDILTSNLDKNRTFMFLKKFNNLFYFIPYNCLCDGTSILTSC